MSVCLLHKDERLHLALSRTDAAEALGVSLRHFQRHIQPELRCVYSGRLRLFPVTELERWLRDNQGARSGNSDRGSSDTSAGA